MEVDCKSIYIMQVKFYNFCYLIIYFVFASMKNKPTLPTSTSSDFGIQPSVINTKLQRKLIITQFIFFGYHFVRLVFVCAVIGVLSAANYHSLVKSFQYARVQQTLDIWSKDVIISIKAIASYNCPQGYQPLMQYYWPGTNQGCVCQTTIQDYDYIITTQGKCTYSMLNIGCQYIKSNKPINYTFWIDNRILCVKRIKNLNFYNADKAQIINNLTKTCNSGENYQINVPQNIQCPVTAISNSSLYDNIVQNITGDKIFSYQIQSGYPIADCKVTQYQFCPQYRQFNVYPNHNRNYNIQPQVYSYCPELQTYGPDPRVTQFDYQTQVSFISKNQSKITAYLGVLNIIQSLPAYAQPQQDIIYKLGFVRYTPWTYTCRNSNQYSLEKTYNHLQLSDESQQIQVYTYVVNFLVAILGFIFSAIYISRKLLECRRKYVTGHFFQEDRELIKKYPNLFFEKNLIFQLGLFIIFQILGLISLIILAVYSVWMYDQYDWFTSAASCTDQLTNNWFSAYKTQIRQIQKSILLCIIFVVVVILLDISALIYRIIRGDLVHLFFGQNSILAPNEQQNTVDKKSNNIFQESNQTQQNFFEKQLAGTHQNFRKDSIEDENRNKIGGMLGMVGFPKRGRLISQDLPKMEDD